MRISHCPCQGPWWGRCGAASPSLGSLSPATVATRALTVQAGRKDSVPYWVGSADSQCSGQAGPPSRPSQRAGTVLGTGTHRHPQPWSPRSRGSRPPLYEVAPALGSALVERQLFPNFDFLPIFSCSAPLSALSVALDAAGVFQSPDPCSQGLLSY